MDRVFLPSIIGVLLSSQIGVAQDESFLKKKLQSYFGKGRPIDYPQYGRLSVKQRASVRRLAWGTYRAANAESGLASEYQARAIKSGKYTMPFTLQKRGKRPEGGWPVFIAMHGGGGVPKKVNDGQWRIMQGYYLVDNVLYIAPRAPTDKWNGFYTHYVFPLMDRLIRSVLLFEDVDPNRIYLIGYSHGGYGAFAIGPAMPDRFAAVHSSAAAPTGGLTSAENLMNTRFTFMVGELDTAYGRLKRCRAFDALVRKLRGNRKETFPVEFEYRPGKGHSNLGDWKKPKTMLPYRRNPVPRKLWWKPTTPTVERFYWLEIGEPKRGMSVEARWEKNTLQLKSGGVAELTIHLDDRLVDIARPVRIVADGKTVFKARVKPTLAALCKSLEASGDPNLAFDVKIHVKLTER